ncbi:DEAD/DEAH box helicase [Companilactobacillus metriopterae]|uniref:DEAD/DEAH box helicase n=1 Tax=Companilactobacillus metriopterae TaxID=1909267 RepID=UPI00100A45ED|nr:DEAD/DEAH box helicase [Companilactobacillus metriopterae]
MKFNELGLDPTLISAVEKVGYVEATPIQAETIPLVLTGEDVIGQAQTGTGKTAAFGLPILNSIDTKDPAVQALIISPTRELAIQTQEELAKLGRDKHAKVQAVFGGADIRRQINGLKNHPQIVVGTPGRLLDHINRKTVKLGNVKTIVLDEADEMLDMGFIEDIESILSNVPNEHQTLLFSATMPKPIMNITKKFMTDPKVVQIKSKELTADNIEQYYVNSKEFTKFNMMTRIMQVQQPDLGIIFGRTKRRVDELIRGLQARGFKAEGIHGDMSQDKRSSVLKKFKSGKLEYLVATDVAARGIDVSGVTHVYNYDIPQDQDSYVHRIGRTGRAGKSGVSVTFVAPNETSYLRAIEKLTKKRMTPLAPPTDDQLVKGQMEAVEEEIQSTLAHGKGLDRFKEPAEELLKKYTPEQLVQIYLNSAVKDEHSVPVNITPERPLPSRDGGSSRGGNRRGGGGHSGNRSRNGHGGSSRGGQRRSYRDRDRDSSGSRNGTSRKDTHSKSRTNPGNKANSSNRKSSSKKSFKIRTSI